MRAHYTSLSRTLQRHITRGALAGALTSTLIANSQGKVSHYLGVLSLQKLALQRHLLLDEFIGLGKWPIEPLQLVQR